MSFTWFDTIHAPFPAFDLKLIWARRRSGPVLKNLAFF